MTDFCAVSTYLDEKVRVQVGTSRVNFVRVLNSASFHQINSLNKKHQS